MPGPSVCLPNRILGSHIHMCVYVCNWTHPTLHVIHAISELSTLTQCWQATPIVRFQTYQRQATIMCVPGWHTARYMEHCQLRHNIGIAQTVYAYKDRQTHMWPDNRLEVRQCWCNTSHYTLVGHACVVATSEVDQHKLNINSFPICQSFFLHCTMHILIFLSVLTSVRYSDLDPSCGSRLAFWIQYVLCVIVWHCMRRSVLICLICLIFLRTYISCCIILLFS